MPLENSKENDQEIFYNQGRRLGGGNSRADFRN